METALEIVEPRERQNGNGEGSCSEVGGGRVPGNSYLSVRQTFEAELGSFHIRVNDMTAVAIRHAQDPAFGINERWDKFHDVSVGAAFDAHLQGPAIVEGLTGDPDQAAVGIGLPALFPFIQPGTRSESAAFMASEWNRIKAV